MGGGVPMKLFFSLATTLFFLMLYANPTLAQHRTVERSPKVDNYLHEASYALEDLQERNLLKMEQSLGRGFLEIQNMVDSYTPDPRTNAYLRLRGWGQLVWTQIMHRLMAIQNGLYEDELRFAERVALDRQARASLDLVETSVQRLYKLLEAKNKFGFDVEIDAFAQDLFKNDTHDVDYKDIIAEFQSTFLERRDAVVARIESGEHPGIFDPADLPKGTRYAKLYQEHLDRLSDETCRVDEIFIRLAEFDGNRLNQLMVEAQTAPSEATREAAKNEIKVQLMVFEDALDASETDPSFSNLMQYFERSGYLAFEPWGGYPEDFHDAMVLIHQAKSKLEEQTQPDALKNMYAMGDVLQ